jgi:hypothetical protein
MSDLRTENRALRRERAQLLWIARQVAKAESFPLNQVPLNTLERLFQGLSSYRADYGDPIARYDELGEPELGDGAQ